MNKDPIREQRASMHQSIQQNSSPTGKGGHTVYGHVVADIETLGTEDDCVVLSLGLVKLDLSGHIIEGSQFYCELTLHDQFYSGRVADAGTQKWWSDQSEDARKVFLSENKTNTTVALDLLSNWFSCGSHKDVKPMVWGNGPEFDNRIIANLYDSFDMECPFSFRQSQTIRMCKGFFPELVKDIKFDGTLHHALDDAMYEALCLQAVLPNLPNPFEGMKHLNAPRDTFLDHLNDHGL